MSRTTPRTFHDHTFSKIVRERGSRVRYGCDSCPKIGPWIKIEKRRPKKIERIDTYGDENQPEVDFSTYTLPVLREMAKTRGLVGYTKWNKATLVSRLQEV